jgi:hypothetical protein
VSKLTKMKSRLLLPHKYKLLGWYILIPATLLGIITLFFTDVVSLDLEAGMIAIVNEQFMGQPEYFKIINMNIIPTVTGVLFLTGALLVSFSKEKVEDEFIFRLRQSSLLWAVLVNYSLLLACFIFIHGMAFLNVMVYNMFTILVIFIIRFHYILYRNSKEISNEEYHQSAPGY